MEHENVTWMRSAQYKNDVVVYKSVRKPGCVYKFFHKRGKEYCCCRCRELGKWRSIFIVNDTVVGCKNPEEDHHEERVLLDENAAKAQEVDRNMRQEVHSNGKRLREAYNEMLMTVAKKFRSSEEQVNATETYIKYCDEYVSWFACLSLSPHAYMN